MGNAHIFIISLICEFVHVFTRGHTAYSRTEADGVRSPLQAAAVWQPAGHHRCPQRRCVCVRCEPQPHVPTPSEAAAS